MKKIVLISTILIMFSVGCAKKEAPIASEIVIKENSINLSISSHKYTIITSSSVSYIVDKEWLKKSTEKVLGRNRLIKGSFEYNDKAGELNAIKIEIDTGGFDSGNKSRDKVVEKMLGKQILIASVDKEVIFASSSYNMIPLNLSINEVTKKVLFGVTANTSSSYIMASGSSTIMMSDFNIKAPSILNVYGVNNKLDIIFDITSKLNSK